MIHFKFLYKTFYLFLLMSGSAVFAAAPNWSVKSSDYANSMTLTGIIRLDNIESRDVNDKVAAFVNGECRGVVSPVYISSADRYVAFLLVYSNNSSDENITFKVYDADKDVIVELKNNKQFVVDEIRGSVSEPYVFLNTTPSKEIASFGITGVTSSATIDASQKSVVVKVPSGTNASELVANFQLSEGAVATVKGVEQVNGETTNDFTSPVTYTITALDGTTDTWTVTVEKSLVSGIDDFASGSSLTIYPVPAKDEILLRGSQVLTEDAVWNIYNQQGAHVMGSSPLFSMSDPIIISALPAGIYLVRVSGMKGEFSKVFIKE